MIQFFPGINLSDMITFHIAFKICWVITWTVFGLGLNSLQRSGPSKYSKNGPPLFNKFSSVDGNKKYSRPWVFLEDAVSFSSFRYFPYVKGSIIICWMPVEEEKTLHIWKVLRFSIPYRGASIFLDSQFCLLNSRVCRAPSRLCLQCYSLETLKAVNWGTFRLYHLFPISQGSPFSLLMFLRT